MLNAECNNEDITILKDIEEQKLKFLVLNKDSSNIVNDEYERPTIAVVSGEHHHAVDQAENALLSSDTGIFQRAGQVVRIVPCLTKPKREQGFIKRADEALVICSVDHINLTEILGRIAIWKKFDTRQKGDKLIDCPERIAKTLLARKEWNLPLLTGVIQAPTLRSDGSILETPGYDEETGLYFNPGETHFPKILEFPTKDEAQEALKILQDLLKDFPFTDEASKSVAISAILTGLTRKSLRTAPLHGFTAPKMGSGKSLLADVVGLIATGKPISVISQAENETEEAKRLLAVLLEGDPIVCYDNIERPFGSPSLCSVLTQTEYKGRLLGQTKTIAVPTNITFLATGNNLIFIGDTSTRALLCQIIPKEERPEEREFVVDLRMYIPQHRGEIVQAALTILRAYHIQGCPKQVIHPFGRFEDWSNTIRSALIWIGMADPCNSRKEIEESDPVRLSLANLFSAWHKEFGDLSIKTKDIVKRAREGEEENHEVLRSALEELGTDSRGNLNEKTLGHKLASFKNRMEAGYKLESIGKSQGYTLWRVKRTDNQ